MPLTTRRLLLSGLLLYLCAVIGTFVGFDQYSQRAARSLVDMVVKSEAAAFQQGNLISSVTKLQSAIVASDTLKGVAAYDLSADPEFKLPLIVLGQIAAPGFSLHEDLDVTAGPFKRVIVRGIGNQKALLFYFNSAFARWSFMLFALTLTLFSGLVAYLGMRIQHVRSTEQASALIKISKQVAHDINSPLSALKITADTLARKGVPVDLLRSGISRIEEIVRDLRADADQLSSLQCPTPFVLSEVVREIVAEKRLEHANFDFELDLQPDLYALGDSAQFRRVLSNIVNNAVEASAPGQAIQIRLINRGKRNALTVQDQGKGMTQEQLRHVFKSGVSFGKPKGTGLGLSHAEKTLAAMGGKVEIESKLQQGTVVTLLCPAADLC